MPRSSRSESAETEVDVGVLQLTVRSSQGGRYTLLPPEASGLSLPVHEVVSRGVTSKGEVVFGPLPPGQYVLRELRSGAERLIELDQSCAVDAPEQRAYSPVLGPTISLGRPRRVEVLAGHQAERRRRPRAASVPSSCAFFATLAALS